MRLRVFRARWVATTNSLVSGSVTLVLERDCQNLSFDAERHTITAASVSLRVNIIATGITPARHSSRVLSWNSTGTLDEPTSAFATWNAWATGVRL